MNFSIMIVQTTPDGTPERYQEMIDQVRLADELGYRRVWITCHHFTDFSRPSNLVVAAHLAARTQRIRLGIGVAVLPLEHPLRVLEDAAVVDHLSGGRVDLGIGRGIQPEAFAGFDIPMDEATGRFEEAAEIIRRAWGNERFSYDGHYWSIPELTVLPRPLQKPHPPIWQVGVSPGSITRAATSGFHGLIGSYMNTLAEVESDVRLWYNGLRDDERTGTRPLLAHNELVYVADTDEQAAREAEEGAMWYSRSAGKTWKGDVRDLGLPDSYDHWRGLSARVATLDWPNLLHNRSLIGSPATVAEKIELLRSWGVDELIAFTSFGTLPIEKVTSSMRLFAEKIMPDFTR